MASTPTTVGRWSDELIFKFIALYRERTCLWQSDNPHYKCKALRQDALASLVAAMALDGFDVNSCKLKIKNLRSHYCQELKKIRYSRECGAPEYRPSLAWFPLLHAFLQRYVHQNVDLAEAITTYAETKMMSQEDEEAVSRLQDDDEDLNDDREEFNHDAIPDIIIKQETEDDPVPDECQYNTYDRKRLPPPVPKYRRPKRNSFKMEQPETEFDIFCRSVALQLNNMPLENALRLQHNIQNLVTEERLNCLHSQQRHESSM